MKKRTLIFASFALSVFPCGNALAGASALEDDEQNLIEEELSGEEENVEDAEGEGVGEELELPEENVEAIEKSAAAELIGEAVDNLENGSAANYSNAGAGTVFYSTASVSMASLSLNDEPASGTVEKTVAEKNAEIIAGIEGNAVTADTIAADISNGLTALKKWNDFRTQKDHSFEGYPFFPTDFDFFNSDYENKLWYYKESGKKRAPDYIFNPVTFGINDDNNKEVVPVTRCDSNKNIIADPHSDKRYYYFIDRLGKNVNETLLDDAVWAEFYPFDNDGNTVESSEYRLITGDETAKIFQNVGSVIVFDGGLGSFPSNKKTRLLDIYNAVINGSLAGNDTYSNSFKKLSIYTPVVYLSGIVTTGESYLILEGQDTSLVFQKTENDRQYNELTVPVIFTGVLDFTGLRSIVVNDSVLINKGQEEYDAHRLTSASMTGSQNAPTLIFGGALEGGKGKNIYIEYSNVLFKGECSAYEGDWYFAYGTNIVFAYSTQTNNPIGVGDMYFRRSSWTLSTLSDNLSERNIYAQISNDIFLDGGSSEDYSLRVFESKQDPVFNESTNTFNRSYKILSGNIAEGPRGSTFFTWGDRTSVPAGDNCAQYQNMSLIFTGDNSGFGVFKSQTVSKNSAGYATGKGGATWALGKTPYNMETLGGISAIPFIFGDGSAFTVTKKDNDGKDVPNYAAIAGYGAFVTGEYGEVDALKEKNYSSVGFQYKSDVEIGNAFFGNIRLVNLDLGKITLTNTANELNAGIWVTGGGAIEFNDIKALGNADINLLCGKLIFTGTDATFSKTLANKSSVFQKGGDYYCDTQSGAWEIDVAAGGTLHWDATGSAGSNFDSLERNVRENDFTKSGAGTLEITSGNLIEPSTSGRTYTGGTNKSFADVYLKGGTLKLNKNASLGAAKTLYMQGGELVSMHDIKVDTTAMTYSSVTDGNSVTRYYSYTGTLLSYEKSVAATDYKTALNKAGFVASLGLGLTFSALGQEGKQAFTYNGEVLYYYDENKKEYLVVGRKYDSGFKNETSLSAVLACLKNSYTKSGNAYLEATDLRNVIDKADNISKLVFNYNGQLVSGLTQLRDGVNESNGYEQDVAYSIVLSSTTCKSTTENVALTIPLGQILSGNLVLDASGNVTSLAADNSFDISMLDEIFPNKSETLPRSVYLSAVKDQASHRISISDGAGTFTLAGGNLTIEFTYFDKGTHETNQINGVYRPSHTYLDIAGTFEVTKNSTLELTFSNKAVLARGVYLLVDAANEITADSINNLSLSGIVLDNESTRQQINLYRGDHEKVKEEIGASDNTQLYLHITPGSAILYWNTDSNIWAQHEKEKNLEANWKFKDGYSLASYDGKTDTNFYQNDSVVFSDVVDEKQTHIISVEGEVNPLQMIVNAEKDDYILKSIEEYGKEKGVVAGNVTLVKEGAGTLTIYTENTYTGGTEITGGTVNALAANALGTGTVVVSETGTLNVGAASVDIEKDANGKIALDAGGNEKIKYFDEAGRAMDAVENVLRGAIQIDVQGTVNIYAGSAPDAGSSLSVGATTGGGTLNAYAANAVGSVGITVSGGGLHAFVDNVFNENVVTVRGSDDTDAGIKAKVFGEAAGSLNNATFDVWGDGIIYADAGNIGNENTTINLYGNTRENYRAGMIVIAADNALDGIGKVSFNMGGVIKVEKGNYDISRFTNWEWQSATGAEIKVGDDVDEQAAKDASLRISSANMVAASTKIIHKTGAGTLFVNMDFPTDPNASTKFMGDFYFDNGKNADGKVVFDFGTAGTENNHLTYAGTLKGDGAIVEFAGTCGEFSETYAHWFENTRVVNMKNPETAAKGTLYLNETLIYMTTEELRDIKYSTRFDAGDVVIKTLPTENGVCRLGTIETSTAASRYDVEVKAVGTNGYVVVTQNCADGTFDGKFVNNTVDSSTYNISIDKYGKHELILSNNNSSTGTLHIYEGNVQIGNGGTTGDWAGNVIAEAGTELHFNFSTDLNEYAEGKPMELFGGDDTTTFSGEGKIVFESGYFKLYNSSAFEAMAGTSGQIVIESNATVVFDYSKDVAAGTAATLNGGANVMLIAGGVNLYDTEKITAGNNFSGTLILAGISDENVVKTTAAGTVDEEGYSAFIDNSFNAENDNLTTIVSDDSEKQTAIDELFPKLVPENNTPANSLCTFSLMSFSVEPLDEPAEPEGNSDSHLALDLTNATKDATLVIDLGNVSIETLLANQHNGVSAIGVGASTVDDSVFDNVSLNAEGTAIDLAAGTAFSGDVSLQNAEHLNIKASAYDARKGILYIAAIPEPSFFGLFAGTAALLLAGTRRRRKTK